MTGVQTCALPIFLRRDRDDSTVSNFTEAACGVSVIDSTHLGLDEVVAEILKLVPDA